MAFKRATKVSAEMSMSSMTDCCSCQSSAYGPSQAERSIVTKPTVSVSIKDWGGETYTYHLNGDETPVQFSDLEDGLVGLLQEEEDPTFSIYSDESVPIKEVVSIMNIAKRNHYKVILATQPE